MGNILLTNNNNLSIYEKIQDFIDKYFCNKSLLPTYENRELELQPLNNTNIYINEEYDNNIDHFKKIIENIEEDNISSYTQSRL